MKKLGKLFVFVIILITCLNLNAQNYTYEYLTNQKFGSNTFTGQVVKNNGSPVSYNGTLTQRDGSQITCGKFTANFSIPNGVCYFWRDPNKDDYLKKYRKENGTGVFQCQWKIDGHAYVIQGEQVIFPTVGNNGGSTYNSVNNSSNSVNASPGSNYDRHNATCRGCNGTGFCRHCNGTGWVNNHKSKCSLCHGTGKCVSCHGSGKIRGNF